MKSTAFDHHIRGLRRQLDLDRHQGARGIFVRSRMLDAHISIKQLPIRNSAVLVDTDGVFFFVPGYSQVGGGDRVRP